MSRVKEQLRDCAIVAIGFIMLAGLYVAANRHYNYQMARVNYCEAYTESLDILGPSNFHNCFKAIK